MFYLLLNVVFASAFTLIIKWVQVRKQEDIVTVGAVNYIVAAACSLLIYLQAEVIGDATMAAVTGGALGVCYFVAYFFVIHAIRWIGAASATVISALSILLPVGCGILIWNEQPDFYQILGVVLAMLSLLLITGRQQDRAEVSSDDEKKRWVRPLVLLSFFVLAGSGRLAQEAFKHESSPHHRPVFLVTAFLVASVPSVVLLVRRRRIALSEFVLGFAMGAANILQTQFILYALKNYDGFVVFPASSAGGILLTTLVATGMLGEQLSRRKMTGIAIATCALVLLNS